MVKCLPTMRETQVWSLGWEDPLEKEMATHFSTLAWKIPWMEKHGRLQSIGSQRVGHYWATSISVYSCHCFLISYTSVRFIPFVSFIVPTFAWNVPLVCLIFLKRSLVFPILLFSFIPLHWPLRKAFLSLLAVLWNTAIRWVYLSFLLCLLLLFFS